MRPIPVLLTIGGALAVAAVVVATIFDGSNENTPGVGQPQTPGATPSCTFIPGEGRVCIGTPQPRDCRATMDHIPFASELVLPNSLPEGIRFEEACLTACPEGIPCNQPAEIKYASEDGAARFQISTAIAETPCTNGSPAPFGPLSGCVRRIPGQGGETVYAVDLQLRGRAHTVIAIIGPDNRITEEELNAVAQDMASQG
jgi:hypothetical protein